MAKNLFESYRTHDKNPKGLADPSAFFSLKNLDKNEIGA